MATLKVGILEPKDFSPAAIDMLGEKLEISLFDGKNLDGFVCDKDVLFVRLAYRIDDNILNKCKRLKYICSPTTGLNHIITDRTDIEIISLRGEYLFLESIRATPEHVFGLTLALLRNYSHAFLSDTNKAFDREKYKGFELYQNNVGIIGMGRIGKITSAYFKAFEANVFFCDNRPVEQEGCIRCNSIDEVIDRSNIILLEADYKPENDKMITYDHFYEMKGKYFVNAARGELVDEDALISFIKKDWFAGVAIDVIDNESSTDNRLQEFLELCTYHNLIITPHIGGATFSSMKRTEEFIAQKLLDVLEKEGKV